MAEWLAVAQGEFVLQRLPRRPRELLRAWDAADEYLLDYLAVHKPDADARLLLVNDAFGALAVVLNAYRTVAVSDSFLAHEATRLNWEANGLPDGKLTLVDSLTTPEGYFDWVLIKVPKTLALLEDQLIRLRPCLKPETRVLVAGMVKSLPSSVWGMLEHMLGSTTTLLAKKKAKLIMIQPELGKALQNNPYPIVYPLENTRFRISNHANVFSRDSLDIGTRFFLQQLPDVACAHDIIDLGCGNGVVGLTAAERNPRATVYFVDESYMAVASAKANFHLAFGEHRGAEFLVGDGLTQFAAESADLILCNPPFHQQHAIGDQIAVTLFKGAKRVLRRGGELWVVGNRHLNYHMQLKKIFANCKWAAANAKFVVMWSKR